MDDVELDLKLRALSESLDENEDPFIGKLVCNKFKVESLIGSGASGSVYKAFHQDLGRWVAIKVLHTNQAFDSKQRARFQREAKLLAAFKNPGVCQILDYETSAQGQPILVLEYVEGKSLKELIASKEFLSAREGLELGIKLCEILGAIHSSGMVHRDIKPDNIKIRRDGSNIAPTILDFGIAKLLQPEEGDSLTTTGGIIGTPAYMSPEQCMGHAVDGRADLYSMALVLYEVCSGRQVFQTGSPVAVMLKHCNDEVVQLKSILKGSSDELRYIDALLSIILISLSKSPDQRYPSAEAMKQDLMLAWQGQGIRRGLQARRIFTAKNLSLVVVTLLFVFACVIGFRYYVYKEKQRDELSKFGSYCERSAPEVARAIFNDSRLNNRETVLHALFPAKIEGLTKAVSSPSKNIEVADVLLLPVEKGIQTVSLVVAKDNKYYLVKLSYALRSVLPPEGAAVEMSSTPCVFKVTIVPDTAR